MRCNSPFPVRVCPQTLAHVVLICVVSLIASIPLLLHGFPYGDDSVEHLCWYTAFARQFWSGEIYPRWLLDANAGLGSPVFFVYGPLPFWVACLLRPMVKMFMAWGSPIRELGLSAALALLISGLAAYVWLREAVGARSALAGAILFLFLPYHFTVDLYVRGALAEFWAFAWMPLTLWFTARLLHGKRYATAGFGISYALLIVTHLFTALLFTAVPAVLAVFEASEQSRRKILLRLGAGMALGVSLSAVYLLPAIRNEKYISPQKLIAEQPDFYYGHNFIFTKQLKAEKTFNRQLSWLTVSMAMTAMFSFAGIAASRNTQARRKSVVWAGISVTGLFLMMSPSRFIWGALPTLQQIQFPWRLNTVLSIAVLVLLSLMIECFDSRRKSAELAICGVALLSTVPWFGIAASAVRRASPWASPELLKREPPSVRRNVSLRLSIDSDQLTPVWMHVPRLAGPESIRRLAAQFRDKKVLPTDGSVAVEYWGARELRLNTRLNSPEPIFVKHLCYPRWKAEVSNSHKPIPIRCSPQGLITVEAPSGEALLSIFLPQGRAERYGLWITIVAVLLVISSVLASFKRKRARLMTFDTGVGLGREDQKKFAS